MEPEEKLWKLNYIAYSVAVGWRHVNDDYQRTPWERKQRPRNVKCEKENFAVTHYLSKASGQHEAIQKQRKMTKRRVKRLTEPIQFKRGIYTKETPSSLYSFIMSWKLRTVCKMTSCLSQ